MRWLIGVLLLICLAASPAGAVMLESGDLYTQAELEKDAVRLRVATLGIFEKGIRPSLTGEEKAAGGEFDWDFPLPGDEEALLNFYAVPGRRQGRMVLPVRSLKALEDTATAYAWLYHNKKSMSSIDLYYTMLRYRDRKGFPGGRFPSILVALGIPDDALKDPRVDTLSLSLRNEAIAFIVLHEFAHLRFRHPTGTGLSAAEIRSGEIEADNFALDVLGRTKTPPFGAVLFFQAQIYSHTHRAEYPTREEWELYTRTAMSHPLGVDRIAAMANYMEGPLARSLPNETVLWQWIAAHLRQLLPTMEDPELAPCVIKVAQKADLSILQPRPDMDRDEYLRICRGR